MNKSTAALLDVDDGAPSMFPAPDPVATATAPTTAALPSGVTLEVERIDRALAEASDHFGRFLYARSVADWAGMEASAGALAFALSQTDLGPLARVVSKAVAAERPRDPRRQQKE